MRSYTSWILREYGLDFIKKLMECLSVIWKRRTKNNPRKRQGRRKTILYLRKNNNIFFSSEIKPLLKNKDKQITLDHNSIDFYLNNRYVPSSKKSY